MPPVTAAGLERLNQLAAVVDNELTEEFNTRYGAWKSALATVPESEDTTLPFALINSTTTGFTRLPEFAALVALGPEIVPLAMNKLADPNEWPAVLIADLFLPEGVRVEFDLEDERVLTGEQGRARLTLDAWLEKQG